jgi:uncharacterized membrane protein
VLGVAFSVTVVALQLASSQFGPRLLRQFLRDRGNQVVLGSFSAIFTYCLLVLRTVRGQDGDDGTRFVPQIAVTGGLVLGVFGVGVLIYFIHHVATSIQADYVVSMVSEDLRDAIDGVMPDPRPPGEPDADGAAATGDSADVEPGGIEATHEGYVQVIDVDALVAVAEHEALVLSIAVRPGHFVTPGMALARTSAAPAAEATARAVRRAFLVGRVRTPEQDVEFAFQQLVEIAIRALSPSINDPVTAGAVIDRLGAALVRAGGRRLPPRQRHGADGRVRVLVPVVTLPEIVRAALDPLRLHAERDPWVVARLIDMVASVARRTDRPALRAALLDQLVRLEQAVREAGTMDADRAHLAERIVAARGALAAPPAVRRTA